MNSKLNEKIMEIFRAYDVRGMFPDQLNEEIAFNIGKGFADTIGAGSSVAVARDVRSSSLAIHEALCKGITSKGIAELNSVPIWWEMRSSDHCTTCQSKITCVEIEKWRGHLT